MQILTRRIAIILSLRFTDCRLPISFLTFKKNKCFDINSNNLIGKTVFQKACKINDKSYMYQVFFLKK